MPGAQAASRPTDLTSQSGHEALGACHRFSQNANAPSAFVAVRNTTLGFGCDLAHSRGGSRVDPTRGTGRELFACDYTRLDVYEALRTKVIGVDQGGISLGHPPRFFLSYKYAPAWHPTSSAFSRARALVLIHPIHPALPNPRCSFKIVGVDRKMMTHPDPPHPPHDAPRQGRGLRGRVRFRTPSRRLHFAKGGGRLSGHMGQASL